MKNQKVNLNGKFYSIKIADNFFKRAFGLMFKDIRNNEGLLFKYGNRKLHIHTFFMKYPIDVIFLKDDFVVDIVSNLKPFKTYNSKVKSNKMFEIKSGALDISKLLGKKLEFND
ncbi:protein of unknown function DUF192 [Methanococcus vannielii SB]|uniref:DUF192 domain-containing protein n=1 Tax=Methanococcus vannielii (strain ATCC 35089 / DSM 1224 / JCM 13029 / OCM 148 / SB) TaxID=406327 RepID=A6URH5_METVS|nr:DUF192 domain-containing protein [Methanococcus vannielii]ABR55097.1 protein of unknown function DUF192 [Methanococcus vannielii SB]